MKSFVELLIVMCLIIIPSAVRAFRWKQFIVSWSYKSPSWPILERLFLHIGLLVLFLYIIFDQPSGIQSLGLRMQHFWIFSFSGIFIWFIIFITQFTISRTFNLKKAKSSDSQVDIMLISSLHNFRQKFLYWIGDIFSIIYQEVFYRGYLLLLWGERTHLFILCATISICLYVINHLHQGRKLIYYHLIAAIFLSTVTLITHSIIPAISTHLFNNVVTRLRIWKKLC